MTDLPRQRSFWHGAAATLVAVLLALVAGAAVAREEIRTFDSAVILNVDGSVDVVETIGVNAEGTDIQHGIYRDIPTRFTDFAKVEVVSDLKVLGVTKDGTAEPYLVMARPAGFERIRIGSPDVTLKSGVYTYAIHYTMTKVGRSYTDDDEILWNATGQGWSFPILKTTASVTLPSGAEISGAVGYIGSPTAQQDVRLQGSSGPTKMSFTTTRTLEPGEGLTVGVMFQKGILALPTGSADTQTDKVANR